MVSCRRISILARPRPRAQGMTIRLYGLLCALLLVPLALLSACQRAIGDTTYHRLAMASAMNTQTDAAKAAQNSVALALLRSGTEIGVCCEFASYDDQGMQAIGEMNIGTIINDRGVIMVVGPFNSSVAKAEVPLIQQAGPVMISPAVTNPCLTRPDYATTYGEPRCVYSEVHPSDTIWFFRLPGHTVVQGHVLAQLADKRGFQHAFVVDDDSPDGKALADAFAATFPTLGSGHTVVDRKAIECAGAPCTPDNLTRDNIDAIVNDIRQLNQNQPTVDLVFYGGDLNLTNDGTAIAGPGGAQLKLALYNETRNGVKDLPMLGGDSLIEPKWAGPAVCNLIAVSPAPDLTHAPYQGAQRTNDFLAFYQAKYGSIPGLSQSSYSALSALGYAALAYDAAKIEQTAIALVLQHTPPKSVSRALVREQVAGMTYTGVTGAISFDSNGDNAGARYFSIWEAPPCPGTSTQPPTWESAGNISALA